MLRNMWIKVVIALCFAVFVTADDVLEFGDSDFDSKIADHETALVMFYAPWCGHCKRLKPDYEKAATTLRSNDPPVQLLKVDCTDSGKDLCSRYGVSGYPTLKIFRGGEMSSDYNGPRDTSGIIKYMRAQVGPASKELKSIDDAEAFIGKPEVGVVFFGADDSKLKEPFLKAADKDRETVRFAHSLSADVNKKYDYKNKIVLFRPKHLHNKFEDATVVYEGGEDKTQIGRFIKDNYHGMVGHRTPDTAADFKPPVVVAYYNVDYIKNTKGTNYWRNRVLKVAQGYKDFTYAISNKDDFQHELNEFGIELTLGDKPVICARSADGQKYVMEGEFSMDTFETFLKQLKEGELEPYLKSEPVPDSQDGPVLVAVGKNFDDLVTNSGRDALIEFYAPWCGHCKKLAPTFDELGEKLQNEDVDIIKMDATANDVPPAFNVRGFPTLYWKPKGGTPLAYDGGRELDDFISYISRQATEELKGWDRKGKPKKSEL